MLLLSVRSLYNKITAWFCTPVRWTKSKSGLGRHRNVRANISKVPCGLRTHFSESWSLHVEDRILSLYSRVHGIERQWRRPPSACARNMWPTGINTWLVLFSGQTVVRKARSRPDCHRHPSLSLATSGRRHTRYRRVDRLLLAAFYSIELDLV